MAGPALPVTLPERGSSPQLPRAARPGIGRRSRSLARAIAEAMFSSSAGAPSRERLDYLDQELSDFFGHITLRARWLFAACVATIDLLGPVLIGKLPGFARLSIEDRVRVLLRVEASPLSLAFLAVKAILCILYYEHPGAAEEIGWDQRCLLPET